MKKRKMSKDHPTLDRILDHVLARRQTAEADAAPDAATDADALDTHFEACEPCRDAESWLRKLMDAVVLGPSPRAPESLIESAIAIFREEPRAQPEAGGWSLAILARDAFAQPALAGVRGAATGRRLLYQIEGGHLDLEISPAPDDGEHLRLTGQVIFDDRPPMEDLLAILWRDRRAIARAAGDAAGVFVFPRVPPGVYRLDILSLSVHRALRIAELTVEMEEP